MRRALGALFNILLSRERKVFKNYYTYTIILAKLKTSRPLRTKICRWARTPYGLVVVALMARAKACLLLTFKNAPLLGMRSGVGYSGVFGRSRLQGRRCWRSLRQISPSEEALNRVCDHPWLRHSGDVACPWDDVQLTMSELAHQPFCRADRHDLIGLPMDNQARVRDRRQLRPQIEIIQAFVQSHGGFGAGALHNLPAPTPQGGTRTFWDAGIDELTQGGGKISP